MIKLLTLLGTLFLLSISNFSQASLVTAQDEALETHVVKRIAYNPQNPAVLALAGDVFSSGLSRVQPFVMLQDIETGMTISRLVVPDNEASTYPRQLNSLDWSPDGTRLLAGIRGGQVVIWDISATSQSQYEVIHNVVATVDHVNAKWSPDGRWLAVLDDGISNLQIWDGTTFQRRSSITFGASKFDLSWSPGSDSLALGGAGVGPVIYDLGDGGELTRREIILGPTIVTGSTGQNPVTPTTLDWHPITNQLAFNDFINKRFYVYDMTALSDVTVIQLDVESDWFRWDSAGTRLLYRYGTNTEQGYDAGYGVLDVATGTTTHQFPIGDVLNASMPVWSPDSTYLTFALNFARSNMQNSYPIVSINSDILSTSTYAETQTLAIPELPESILVFPTIAPATNG